MQYALMIYPGPGRGETLSDAEREAAYAEYSALVDDERCVAGAQLQPAETATSVRVVGGKTLMTDGPFADTKEVLGGFCLVEAADLDEASSWRRASRPPGSAARWRSGRWCGADRAGGGLPG
jgi:hypothetical protein